MARIVFRHEAFRLEFHAPDLGRRLEEARANGLAGDALKCVWTWVGGVSEIGWAEGDEEPAAIWTAAAGSAKPDRAFFFDNAEQDVWIEFGKGCTKGRVELARESDAARFQTRGGRWLYGPLAFGNDVGRADFAVSWEQDGIRKRFRVSFDVLSTKLDYRTDWRRIVQDVEDEYRMLAYDFLRRTYHQFRDNPEGDNSDLVWWNVFKEWQTRFFDACEIVIRRPRTRHNRVEEFRRADRLRILTPALENELAEYRREPAHLYRVERPETTHDTPENRFVKHAVSEIARRHARLARRVRAEAERRGAAKDRLARIDEAGARLAALERAPFFRGVGRFEGLRQVSLVLQQAPGYAEVVRIWAVLARLYALGEGISGLETKDIAELYEIWCFIEVKNRTVAVLGASETRILNKSRGELDELFGTDLAKGRRSRIVVEKKDAAKGDVRLELFYNPRAGASDAEGGRAASSIEKTEAPTGGEQKPDIVLQLVRERGGKDGFRLTYLFDAKYRIDGKTADGTVDKPPEDAINQMHRYRDAIYYNGEGAVPGADPRLKREVIGGYVLFPGGGKSEDFEKAYYWRSIERVNIGALPLRPGCEENEKALEDFIRGLLEKKTEEHLLGMPSQSLKGTELNLEGTTAEDVADRVQFATYPSGVLDKIRGSFRDGSRWFPVNASKCPNPASVRMIVFPHAGGAAVFLVRPGVPCRGPENETKLKTEFDFDLPTADYWLFPVEERTT